MSYNDAENYMIDAAAYGPDDDRPNDDDPAAERMAAYLDTQDAAADWTPEGPGHSLSYDEWNAIRAGQGYPPAEFADYLEYLRNDAASVIVGMLARRWARESNGAGDLPADWIDGPVPF